MNPNKSITGLAANLLVLIIYALCIILCFIEGPCYVCWIFPLVFYFIEKNNQFLQLYMLEGAVLFAFNAIITGILSAIKWGVTLMYFNPIRDYFEIPYGTYALGGVIATLNALFAILALICIIKAWKYEYFKIPLVYTVAQKINAAISKNAQK